MFLFNQFFFLKEGARPKALFSHKGDPSLGTVGICGIQLIAQILSRHFVFGPLRSVSVECLDLQSISKWSN